MPRKIILLGDSTLDNSYWVKEHETVTARLAAKYPNDRVINLAVDGFTTRNVLYGAFRDKAVHSERHTHVHDCPLINLAQHRDATHVILSVGGNDLREELQKLIFATPVEREQALAQLVVDIQTRYQDILTRLKKSNPAAQPVIMLQYTPDTTHDLYGIYKLMASLDAQTQPSYLSLLWFLTVSRHQQAQDPAVAQLHKIMQMVYQPILHYAQEHKIPIIDMASSLDYRDTRFYVAQIEPSALGSEVIAHLISHVIHNHDFEHQSLIYAQPNNHTNNIVAQANHQSWKPYRNQPTADNKSWFGGIYSLFAKTNNVDNDPEEDMDFGIKTLR